MRIFSSLDELRQCAGTEIGVSEWTTVGQSAIDQFAEATGDRQWIHVDQERCRRESPYGRPVAHGFLTVSLIPALMNSVLAFDGRGLDVNYGLNKVRFPAPVPAGTRVRARISLQALEEVEGGAQMTWLVHIECEGGGKPACVAELVTRRYIVS